MTNKQQAKKTNKSHPKLQPALFESKGADFVMNTHGRKHV